MKLFLRTFAVLAVFALACQGATLVFTGALTGAKESPPVASPGTGTVTVIHDSIAHTLDIDADFQNLVAPTTVAHIHCCTTVPGAGTVGVAVTPGTLPGFPVGVTSGSYNFVVDLTNLANYTSGFLGGITTAGEAEAKLLTNLLEGRAYFNIHSTFAPGGEIRDFLQVTPEPGTVVLLGGALVGLAVYRRRRTA
jgi:hypothetical protein